MKKTILIILVVVSSATVKANYIERDTTFKKKPEFTFAWGLIKSKNYPKDKYFGFELNEQNSKYSKQDKRFDSTKYVQKSILWGSIQWTEKKKTTQQ